MVSYVSVVPLAPLEELQASSVQHPRFPAMRWLLHRRRVPVLSFAVTATVTESPGGATNDVMAEAAGGAVEDTKLPCAGIGDLEKSVCV